MQLAGRLRHLKREERLDAVLHALSHQTRRAMLARLGDGPAMVSELAQPFAVTRMAISKHLRVLERARLVNRTIDGRVHQCTLSTKPLQDLAEWLAGYRQFWSDRLDSLARHVEQSRGRKRSKVSSA